LPLAGDDEPLEEDLWPPSLDDFFPLYMTAALPMTMSKMMMETVPAAIMMRLRCFRAFSAWRRSVSGPKSPSGDDDMVGAVFTIHGALGRGHVVNSGIKYTYID